MEDIYKSLKVPVETKKTIFAKIRYWWWDITRNTWFERYIEFPIKDFRKGIHNMLKWLPMVWKDRDWDTHYIFNVLAFKIKNTRDYILKKDRIADFHQERINRYCTLSLKLIDAVREEKYAMEYLDYFKSDLKWNPEFIEGKDSYILEIEEISNDAESFFKKYPRIYKQVLEETKDREGIELTTIGLFISRNNHQRAKKLLFKILEQEMEAWWD